MPKTAPARIAAIALIISVFASVSFAQTHETGPVALVINKHPAETPAQPKAAKLDQIGEFEKLLAADSNDYVSANNLGVLYFTSGRFDEALNLIRHTADAHPQSAQIQLNASIVLGQKLDYIDALKYAQAAFQAAPGEEQIRQQLCDMYLATQDTKSAITCYEPLVSGRTPDVYDLFGYGQALLLTGEFAEAETAIRKAIAASPRFANAYNALGMTAYREKHYDEAVEAFREAVSLAPDQAEFRYNMAVADMAVRNKAGAISQYNLLKRCDPKLAESLYKMMFANQILLAGR